MNIVVDFFKKPPASSSPNSRTAANGEERKLTEDETKKLREENERLKEALQKIQAGIGSGEWLSNLQTGDKAAALPDPSTIKDARLRLLPIGAYPGAEREWGDFYSELASSVKARPPLSGESNEAPPSSSSLYPSLYPSGLSSSSPSSLAPSSSSASSLASASLLASSSASPGSPDGDKKGDDDEETYVECFPDGRTVEIRLPKEDLDATEIKEGLGGGYVVIGEADLKNAMADYVAKSVTRYFPEARQLSPEELKGLLDTSFYQLKEKGSIRKLWDWGQYVYLMYGYGSWALRLYREPAVVRMVARYAFRVAQWVFVLVV